MTNLERAKRIRSDINVLIEGLEGSNEPITNIRAEQTGERQITVFWEGIEGLLDIEFYAEGELEWKHSANLYGHVIPAEQGIFPINYNPDVPAGKKYFRIVQDGVPSEAVSAELVFEKPIEPDIKNMVWGWWYDEDTGERDSANTIKVYGPDLDKALKTDFDIVVYLGGFEVDDSVKKWKERLENKGRYLHDADPDRIKAVILRDEPRPKGWESAQLELLIDTARDVFGNQFDYTYSFTRKSIDLYDDYDLPQNTNLIWWNYYPFYALEYPTPEVWGHARTEQEFDESFERTLRIAREKSSPGCKFMITTQAFNQTASEPQYEMKWRTPPLDAPLWYARFISKNEDMLGALHFVYDGKDNRWTGAKDLPGLDVYGKVLNQIE